MTWKQDNTMTVMLSEIFIDGEKTYTCGNSKKKKPNKTLQFSGGILKIQCDTHIDSRLGRG